MAPPYVYAIGDDLIPVFRTVEGRAPLKYTTAGRFSTRKDVRTYERGELIPSLGVARGKSTGHCAWYLVTAPDTPIGFREQSGAVFVNHLTTDDAISLTVGGMWEGVAIAGNIGTAVGSSLESKDLMKRFRSALRKHFTRVGYATVGPKALALLKAGGRLAFDTQSPPEYDLALESSGR